MLTGGKPVMNLLFAAGWCREHLPGTVHNRRLSARKSAGVNRRGKLTMEAEEITDGGPEATRAVVAVIIFLRLNLHVLQLRTGV